MREVVYRGYKIRYHCSAVWFANIFRPGSPRPIVETPTATRDEGVDILLQRIQQIIDREVENAGNGDEKGNG